MKYIITVAFAIISITAFAQKESQIHLLEEFSKAQHPHILAISLQQKQNSAAPFMTERLIGYKLESFTAGNWENNDSIYYSYTGTNGNAEDADNTCTALLNFDFTNNLLEFERRRTNTFNANGQLTSYIIEIWNVNVWENVERFLYTYTAAGLNETLILQEWQNGVWVNRYKTTSLYNASGLVLSYTQQDWTNNAWVNSNRYIYTFDSNNNETYYAYESWGNNAWESDYTYTTTYNANGDIQEQLYKENLGFGLENRDKTLYTYNGSLQNTQTIQQVWVLNSTWLNFRRYTFTYGTNGKVIENTTSDWNSNTNVWENVNRYTFDYDASTNNTSEITEEWVNNVWLNKYRSTFAYNAVNLLTYQKREDWMNNAWINTTQDNYTFDNNGFLLIDQRDNWVNNAWQGSTKTTKTATVYGNISTYLYQNWQNNMFTNVSRAFYTYESFDNGLSSIQENTFGKTILYPNPSSNVMNLDFVAKQNELVTASIFNIAGNQVLTLSIESNIGDNCIVVNTQELPNGFYTIQLQSVTSESSLKFVVAK